jgi:GT2 family glycosyltransferase
MDEYGMDAAPDVAVVVVTYNSAAVVERLLDSVPAALDGLAADVVVVDNSSTDETVELVARRTDCRLVRSNNEGYSAGFNTGVSAAMPASALVVLNPDTRLAPGALRLLVEGLGRDHVGITVPRIEDESGRLQWSLRREPTLLRAIGLGRLRAPALSEFVHGPAAYDSSHPTDWATGAVMATSRECYDALGGWDESYFLYSEETDYCLRARDRGYLTWYVADAVATHVGGGSGRSDTTHQMQVLNRVRLYRRRHGAVSSWFYYLLNLLAEASWVARGHRPQRAAIRALLHPGVRPPQLGLSSRLMPS